MVNMCGVMSKNLRRHTRCVSSLKNTIQRSKKCLIVDEGGTI